MVENLVTFLGTHFEIILILLGILDRCNVDEGG